MRRWLAPNPAIASKVAGPAADVIECKRILAFAFLLRFGLFLLILANQSLLVFVLFVLLFGFTQSINDPINTLLMGRLYGLSHVGLIAGLISTVHYLAGGLWAYLGGVIFDRTGSYRLAFLLSAMLAFVAWVCSMFIVEKKYQAHQ